ncbi:hypothetical protein ACGFYQ_05195 [Streptomyces sp. NPDC048258]|uniref:hypothetical protein n=1 Tax=Streptomyces sp. NPDC048258 TaxID=3365527 RepID=UPI003723A047
MFPDRNPFPAQATMTLDAMATYGLEGTPTAMSRIPLQRLESIQRRYLDDPVAGRAAALHGPHGSGKTHTLLVAMDRASRDKTSARPRVVLYVRADGPDPLLLYRKLMSRWTATELSELAEQAFAGYAMDEFIASRDSVTGETQDTRRLRENPDLVKQAIDDNELSHTAVVNRLDDDIRRIQGRYGNFERVLRSLSNPALCPVAHRWLLAEDVHAEELVRLGVSGVIGHPAEIRTAIHVLAALARRAGRPLTLAMDQVEAFLRTSDGTIDVANAGLLRGVIEDLVGENAFVVCAIAEQVWRDMPPDVRQRFGPSEIQTPDLSEDEANDVLASYLAPWKPEPGQPRTFPFLTDAVRQLLVESGGNLRRFIQASHVVIDKWTQVTTGIDEEGVRCRLASAGGEWAPTEADVRRAVEKALQNAGRHFTVDYEIDGQRVDYVVLRGTRIMLAVEISEAVFGQDEAVQAVRQMEKIQALRRHQSSVVLVVVGYSSPDVRDRLQEAFGRVVIASSPDFVAELERTLRTGVPEEDLPNTALDQRLERLREELVTLIEQRGEEERLVSARLQQVTGERSSEEWKEQLRHSRLRWLQEQVDIEREFDHWRSRRRLDEVGEIVQLHDEYVMRRADRFRTRRERQVVATCTALVAIVFGVLTAQAITFSSITSLYLLIVAAAAIVVLVLASVITMRQRRPSMPAPIKVRDLDDLNRLARHEVVPHLHSVDPLERYAAVVGQFHAEEGPRTLSQMALKERSTLIRRSLLTEAAALDPATVDGSLRAGLDQADLSGGVEACADIPPSWEHLPGRLRIVALLRPGITRGDGQPPPFAPRSWLEQFVCAATEAIPVSPSVQRLAYAYAQDDDELLADALRDVSERDLRQAVGMLSPVGEDGIGGYYWLNTGDVIRETYLFMRKALYFLATGIEGPSHRRGDRI